MDKDNSIDWTKIENNKFDYVIYPSKEMVAAMIYSNWFKPVDYNGIVYAKSIETGNDFQNVKAAMDCAEIFMIYMKEIEKCKTN